VVTTIGCLEELRLRADRTAEQANSKEMHTLRKESEIFKKKMKKEMEKAPLKTGAKKDAHDAKREKEHADKEQENALRKPSSRGKKKDE